MTEQIPTLTSELTAAVSHDRPSFDALRMPCASRIRFFVDKYFE